MRPLGRIWRDLTGQSADRFAELLDDHLDAVLSSIRTTRAALNGERDHWVQTIEDLEHVGDRCRADLIRELSGALTTPIDHEDLFRLSRSIDDVLDNVRDFTHETQLYEPADVRVFDGILDALARGTDGLRQAVARLVQSPQAVLDASWAPKHGATLVRTQYEQAMAELLHRPLTLDTLRVRELLRRLDIAGLRLSEAADTLADGALKRSG